MSPLRLLAFMAILAALAACAPAQDAETETAPAEESAAPVTVETQPEAQDEEESLHPLEVAAREVCAAGDEGFAAALPEGAGFASRGPDARVHAAWKLDGDAGETVISTPALNDDARMVFDGAVADFLRHNLVAGFDREGLTGAFRFRDGRFCVVQTEREVVEALRDAVATAESQLDADG